MRLTQRQAAARVGVSESTIEQWVKREQLVVDQLHPTRGRLFDEDAVIECFMARRSKAWHARVDAAAQAWRARRSTASTEG